MHLNYLKLITYKPYLPSEYVDKSESSPSCTGPVYLLISVLVGICSLKANSLYHIEVGKTTVLSHESFGKYSIKYQDMTHCRHLPYFPGASHTLG